MLIRGPFLIYGGDYDYQGDKFSDNCKIVFPNDVTTLPVVMSDNTGLIIGKVVEIYDIPATFNEKHMIGAVVSIHDQYKSMVRNAKALVTTCALCIWGNVNKDDSNTGGWDKGRNKYLSDIHNITIRGLMLGANSDQKVPGFTYLDPDDKLVLYESDSPYHIPPVYEPEVDYPKSEVEYDDDREIQQEAKQLVDEITEKSAEQIAQDLLKSGTIGLPLP